MPASEHWRRKREKILAACFATVSGYTDAITILRWRCFATMMTGNVLFLGRSMVRKQLWLGWDRLIYYVLILNFGIGVVLYKLAEKRWPNRGASIVGLPLGAVMFSAEVIYMHVPHHGWDHRWLAAGLSPMFGMLMAACAGGKLHAPTTMLTGHIVTVATVGAEWLTEKEPLSKSAKHKATVSGWVIFCTFAGCGIGALASLLTEEAAEGLLLPVPPTLALLLWCYDHIAKPRSLVKGVQRRIRERRGARRRRRRSDDASSDEDDDGSTIESDSACDEDDSAFATPQASAGAPEEARDLEGGDGAAPARAAQAATAGAAGAAMGGEGEGESGGVRQRLEGARSGQLDGHRDDLAPAASNAEAPAHGPPLASHSAGEV